MSKLLDTMRSEIRVRHYSIRTEQTYCDWVKRYCHYHKQHSNGEVRSTTHRRPLILAYYEAYVFRTDAETRERFLKSGSGRSYLKKQMRVFFSEHPLRTVASPKTD